MRDIVRSALFVHPATNSLTKDNGESNNRRNYSAITTNGELRHLDQKNEILRSKLYDIDYQKRKINGADQIVHKTAVFESRQGQKTVEMVNNPVLTTIADATRKYKGSKSIANDEPSMARYFDDSGIDTARDSSISPRRTSTESFSPGSSSSENGTEIPAIGRGSKSYSTLPPLEIKVNNNGTGKWKYLQKDQEKLLYADYDVFLTLDENNKERGFGFTLKGGREKRELLSIETVIKNSPADKAGIQICDLVLEIDGEEVQNQYLSKVNPTIREAMRTGDLEMHLRRRQKSQGDSPMDWIKEKENLKPRSASVSQSPSSKDVANIRKSFEQLIEQERASNNCATNSFVPTPSFAHYSHLAFPRTKAQAAYVVSRALAPKVSKMSRFSTPYLQQSVEKASCNGIGVVKENKTSITGETPTSNSAILEDEFLDETLEPVYSNISDIDEKMGVTSIKRYHSVDNVIKQPAVVRSTRLKTDNVRCHETSRIIKEESIYRDPVNVQNATKNPTAKTTSVLAALPYHKQTSLSSQSSTCSPIPSTPSRKISSASLFDIQPPFENVAQSSYNTSIMSKSIDFSGFAKERENEKQQMVENRRKLSAADRCIESVENLANKILKEKTSTPPFDLVFEPTMDAGTVKIRPPSPKFPTTGAKIDCNNGCQGVNESGSKKDNDKRMCSKCSMKIGNGAAMAIDSLNMIFHLTCFVCHSCNVALGDGACGTDVRVVSKRLLCQICYENEIM